MVKRNHHGAHDNTKKDVGGQPGQVSPTIDQLPSISDTCHLDIEAYHYIPPLFSERIFYSTKTQQPPAEGGPGYAAYFRGHTITRDSGELPRILPALYGFCDARCLASVSLAKG